MAGGTLGHLGDNSRKHGEPWGLWGTFQIWGPWGFNSFELKPWLIESKMGVAVAFPMLVLSGQTEFSFARQPG